MDFQKRKLFIFLVLLFLLLLPINYFHLSYRMRNFVSLKIPLCRTLERLGSGLRNFPSYFYQKKRLLEMNNYLEQENNKLLSEKEKLIYLEQENQDLRKLLNVKDSKKFQYIMGQLVMRSTSEDCIFVNKGLSDGVKKGMTAVSPDFVLLGKVKEVFDNHSVISLVFQRNNIFDVKGPDDIFGIAQGDGPDKIVVNNVSQRKEVNEGDLFFTSPYSEIYPPGLLVGKVMKIEKINVEPFQRIILKPAFDINKLRNIFLIK